MKIVEKKTQKTSHRNLAISKNLSSFFDYLKQIWINVVSRITFKIYWDKDIKLQLANIPIRK